MKLLFPSAEHLADFSQWFRDPGVSFRVERLQFPCDLEKVFQRVEFRAGAQNNRQFLFAG